MAIRLSPNIIGKKVRIIRGYGPWRPGMVGEVVRYGAARIRGGVVWVNVEGIVPGQGQHYAENLEGYNE